MKNLIKLITGFLLLLSVLWSTTGITVYSHYCSESKGVIRSLFVNYAKCEHHEKNPAMKSCCKEEKRSCQTENADSDCCATQKQVFKLASVYTIPGEKQQVKIFDFKLFEYKEIQVEEHIVFIENFKTMKELPPGNFGKKLVLAIQQQKITPAHLI
ncbi:MAG: hypothetical protein DRI88_06920 [Bacteroidetes bacterium]|nr:MAG: hypothetical protein DRI88_06920 [Bacteroidota bacterium]RLD87785.1 MAG: hypothetical protein DRJ02_05520 [Bacteroidota bacterium]